MNEFGLCLKNILTTLDKGVFISYICGMTNSFITECKRNSPLGVLRLYLDCHKGPARKRAGLFYRLRKGCISLHLPKALQNCVASDNNQSTTTNLAMSTLTTSTYESCALIGMGEIYGYPLHDYTRYGG